MIGRMLAVVGMGVALGMAAPANAGQTSAATVERLQVAEQNQQWNSLNVAKKGPRLSDSVEREVEIDGMIHRLETNQPVDPAELERILD